MTRLSFKRPPFQLSVPRPIDLLRLNNYYVLRLSKSELDCLAKFNRALFLGSAGSSIAEIAFEMKTSRSTIEKWLRGKSQPLLARILTEAGHPKPSPGMRWLSINSTRGGRLVGPWILVPDEIKRWSDLLFVLNQLSPNLNGPLSFAQFDISQKDLIAKKPLLFAYFLGVLIGDAGKCGVQRKNRISRRVQLSLSQHYPSNFRFGQFVAMCACALGLRMSRIRDTPPGKMNVYPFYRWSSQSSALVSWIFNVVLGLKDGELTTYDAVKMNWILDAPVEIKTCFIQGLADSDGYLDLSSLRAGIVTQPNTLLVKRILCRLGISGVVYSLSAKKEVGLNLEAVLISLADAEKLPLFNPLVNGYRRQLLKKMFWAKRSKGHWPVWLVKRVETLASQGFSGTGLVEKVLNEQGWLITSQKVNQRIRKMKVGMPLHE